MLLDGKIKEPKQQTLEYYNIFRDMSKFLSRLVSGGLGSWLDVSLEEGLWWLSSCWFRPI